MSRAMAFFLFSASAALAAPRELVALHPLVIIGGEAADEPLHGAFAAEAARLDVDLVPSEQVRASLAAQRNQSCVGSDRCLAELARGTSASRAVLVTISPNTPRVVLSGKVVSRSGAVLRQIPSREYPNGKGEEAARAALKAFLAELDLGAVELAGLQPDAKTEVPPPYEVSRKAPAEPRPLTLRSYSYIAFGVAGAALVGSGVVAASASSESALLDTRLADGALVEGDEDARRLERSLQAKSAAATWLMVAAGVSAATGGALFYLSGQRLAVAPTEGGAVAAWAVDF